MALLATAGAVVLALLTVFAIELSNTQAKSRTAITARVHERSVLAAALLDSLFQTVQQQRPHYEQVYGGRTVSSRVLDHGRQQNVYLALLDRRGHVLASSRGFTAQARADLTQSAALALVRAGHPWGLGNVLPYGTSGVVNLAIAFPTPYGERFLLAGLRPHAFTPFLEGELRRIRGVEGSRNYVIDGTDTVLASTNPAKPAGSRFTAAAQVLALRRPSGEHNGYYYDQVRLANSTWRVTLAAPAGRLFASVSGFAKWLPWLIFAAFAAVAATAFALAGRVLRSAESELRDANGRLASVNQQLEEANRALAHDALHDPLTGLPNRALFMDRLEHVLQRSLREPTAGCAVLFIDLDRFKFVNDSLSHAVGDRLLVAVATRVNDLLRPGDTVARIGGDEFALLLDGVTNEHDAAAVAERIHEALRPCFELDTHRLFIGASIGIALRSATVSAEELMRNADIAMYDAKRRGRDRYAMFDESMRRRVVDRVARENELRRAIDESLIEVRYQPIIDLRTGEIRHLEALARWPQGWGTVAPSEFIPIAEESGLIRPLGRHVLRTALGAIAQWRRTGIIGEDVGINVNISRRELDDPALPGEILAAIHNAGVPGNALHLEITESVLIQEAERMHRIASEVCSHGVSLHLDDFGTAYSSLASLLQFPVTALKIDRSFITSVLGHDHPSETIVRGTIALAHGLGLHATAEGIEHPAELEFLRALGCDLGQGHLFSEPGDHAQTEELLRTWNPRSLSPDAEIASTRSA